MLASLALTTSRKYVVGRALQHSTGRTLLRPPPVHYHLGDGIPQSHLRRAHALLGRRIAFCTLLELQCIAYIAGLAARMLTRNAVFRTRAEKSFGRMSIRRSGVRL